MLGGVLAAFKSSLELIGLAGLILDAAGALIVLGPEVPSIAKLATYVERKQMHYLLDELEQEGVLHEGVGHFHKLYRENTIAHIPAGFEVEEMKMRGNEVVFGLEGLEDGKRMSRSIEEFREWINEYPGVDWEYYLAGGGLLLTGFLFQIVPQSAKINLFAGVVSLIAAVFAALYLVYRAWRSTGLKSSIMAIMSFRE